MLQCTGQGSSGASHQLTLLALQWPFRLNKNGTAERMQQAMTRSHYNSDKYGTYIRSSSYCVLDVQVHAASVVQQCRHVYQLWLLGWPTCFLMLRQLLKRSVHQGHQVCPLSVSARHAYHVYLPLIHDSFTPHCKALPGKCSRKPISLVFKSCHLPLWEVTVVTTGRRTMMHPGTCHWPVVNLVLCTTAECIRLPTAPVVKRHMAAVMRLMRWSMGTWTHHTI